MSDEQTTMATLKSIIDQFIGEREWYQFHNPKDLSMTVVVEGNELMEKFLWVTGPDSYKTFEDDRSDVEDELADVLISVIAFANIAKVDLAQALERKVEKNRQKYPVEKAKGRYTKYTKL